MSREKRTTTENGNGNGNENGSEESRTMADVDHTNPQTGETFSTVFHRGPAVADGGTTPERRATDEAAEAEAGAGNDDDRMQDVDHTAPNDADPNRVWERGGEPTADEPPSENRSDDVE
jgi:hypothetical protein